MTKTLIAAVCLCLGILTGCANATDRAETGMAGDAGSMPFTGKIVYNELEAGFWGIVTDDGKRLDPQNLPDSFQVDGLRVRGQAVPRPDVMTIRMWGSVVELVDIEKVD